MTSILLHIGAHKTGTTAIQSCFDANAKLLSARGVTYPRCNWYHHAQHRLAFAMRGMTDPLVGDRPDLDSEIAELNAAVAAAPARRIFISSEELFGAPRAAIATLRQRIVCRDVRILAFVRRPDDLLLSIYNQNVKTPNNSFAFPLASFLDDPVRINRDLAARDCVESWAAVFGCENVVLRRYEDGSPLGEVLALLGLPRDAVSAPADVNSSVPGAVAEVMRLSKAAGIAPELREELYRVANRVFEGYPRMDLSAEQRRHVLDSLQAEYDALFVRFGMENTYRPEAIAPDLHPSERDSPVILLARVVEALLRERNPEWSDPARSDAARNEAGQALVRLGPLSRGA